jgi:hypothetical protein
VAAYTVVRFERRDGQLFVVERKRFESDSWFETLRRAMSAGDDWHVALTSHIALPMKENHG